MLAGHHAEGPRINALLPCARARRRPSSEQGGKRGLGSARGKHAARSARVSHELGDIFGQAADHLGQKPARAWERLVKEAWELCAGAGHRTGISGIAASLEIVRRDRVEPGGRGRQRIGFEVAPDIGEGHGSVPDSRSAAAGKYT
jgi:hypothetical protein